MLLLTTPVVFIQETRCCKIPKECRGCYFVAAVAALFRGEEEVHEVKLWILVSGEERKNLQSDINNRNKTSAVDRVKIVSNRYARKPNEDIFFLMTNSNTRRSAADATLVKRRRRSSAVLQACYCPLG
jgi:hypothetical protein